MAHKAGSGHNKSSVVIYLSRPVKAFIIRFSFIFLLLLCLFVLFIGRVDSPFTHSVRSWWQDKYTSIAQYISIPSRFFTLSRNAVSDYFFVYSKNDVLRKENLELHHKLAILSRAKVENSHLRSLLDFVKERPYERISVRVVGDASGPFLRSILINAGSSDGVEVGQAVVSGYGLIGRVSEVADHSARVLLLTDIHSRIPVISGLSRQRSVMTGHNRNHPSLAYLPKDTELLEGEEMVTSGDGDLFPSEIPIGLVYVDDKGKFMVKPYTNWQELELLSVLMLKK